MGKNTPMRQEFIISNLKVELNNFEQPNSKTNGSKPGEKPINKEVLVQTSIEEFNY